jgi:hypothetical protein
MPRVAARPVSLSLKRRPNFHYHRRMEVSTSANRELLRADWFVRSPGAPDRVRAGRLSSAAAQRCAADPGSAHYVPCAWRCPSARHWRCTRGRPSGPRARRAPGVADSEYLLLAIAAVFQRGLQALARLAPVMTRPMKPSCMGLLGPFSRSSINQGTPRSRIWRLKKPRGRSIKPARPGLCCDQ